MSPFQGEEASPTLATRSKEKDLTLLGLFLWKYRRRPLGSVLVITTTRCVAPCTAPTLLDRDAFIFTQYYKHGITT
jgi:hypothetical protein